MVNGICGGMCTAVLNYGVERPENKCPIGRKLERDIWQKDGRTKKEEEEGNAMSFNIAIDGPAGAGKSTIAKKIAAELSFIYVDTGAMYRAMGLLFLRKGIDPKDSAAIEAAALEADVTIGYENGEQQVYLNGENVTASLRNEEVGNMASATSIYPGVRRQLTALQKEMAANQDVVMDGRDIGTAVLPDAQLKIYLTASSHVRAVRRYEELKAKGIEGDLAVIEADIIERDQRDMNREISPLRRAEDAVEVDSSNMTIEEVVETVQRLCKERRGV